ncbi:Mannose-1-phosphate guanylyltransferase (GDP) [Desulfovibrio sp. TomC]|nr:mannose-1-phosphate guanylyltransferase/mannose-6-phosphate isomerase [Desulfovibrio sp. TomC]KHK00189.1 Mannose-1-phosphate guanylyltransferase (GDP) [Desulfovibrio sp. TomC]
MFVPVILAGGSGTRLWPMSRMLYPKQFLAFDGEKTMLQATIERLNGLSHRSPVLVCNEEHRFLAAEQMRQMGLEGGTILLEPVGRNTAPAITLAALHATQNGEDPILLVLSADHAIADTAAFQESLERGLQLAGQDKLVTLGVLPKTPETGYGYIQLGEPLGEFGHKVARFVEKPDAENAQAYVNSGDYRWNSGMFLFRAGKYLQELERVRPEILAACRAARETKAVDMHFVRVDAELFGSCPNVSIDYAVMEKTGDAVVVSLDAGWCDVGSWSALSDLLGQDEQANTLKGDVLAKDTTNCFVMAKNRLVATLGISDLVIVETTDAILVAHKSKAQEIKSIVDTLKQQGRTEHLSHREVFRPWGSFDSIDTGERYQVKRITVKPGAKLSVQMHHHRAEHWVVVTGTARVTNGQDTVLLTENQSVYIPVGQLHALENPGVIPLEMIEVQSGSYLGEDDIVRFEDRYGRK